MTTTNPFAPPVAPVTDAQPSAEDRARLERLASGQRLVIYAILASLLAAFAMRAAPALGGALGLAALGLSAVGILRMSKSLGMHVALRVVLLLAMVLPLINWIVLLVLSSRATSRLREAGYKVGLLGASQR